MSQKSGSFLIDWPEVMILVDNDEDFLADVLQDLLAETGASRDEIEKGIELYDFDKIQKSAHTIKGSAAYLRCEKMREVCFDLQNLGQAAMKAADEEHNKFMEDIKTKFEIYKSTLVALEKEITERSSK